MEFLQIIILNMGLMLQILNKLKTTKPTLSFNQHTFENKCTVVDLFLAPYEEVN